MGMKQTKLKFWHKKRIKRRLVKKKEKTEHETVFRAPHAIKFDMTLSSDNQIDVNDFNQNHR